MACSHELRRRYAEEGLNGFTDSEALELLLSYAMRNGADAAAEALLEKFGSLYGVFLASHKEICEVTGLETSQAVLLKLIPRVYQRIRSSEASQKKKLTSVQQYGEFFMDLLSAQPNEVVYEVCLDKDKNILNYYKISVGDVNRVSPSVRRIVANALQDKAGAVLIAHNHPGGSMDFSPEDRDFTKRIFDTLQKIGIRLEDHILVTNSGYVSMDALELMAGGSR